MPAVMAVMSSAAVLSIPYPTPRKMSMERRSDAIAAL